MSEKDSIPSDDELYAGFLKGDSTAYDELMLRHGDSLLWYLYGMVHDYQDAEDLMIEAFARIMVKRPWISENCFKAYLFKTGRNLTARHLKKSSMIETFDLDGMEEVLASDESTEGTAVQNEKTEILNKCLARIEPELREVLYLVYFDGLSYAQVADVMKVKPKRVDHLLQRGKTRMKEELKKEGVEDPYL